MSVMAETSQSAMGPYVAMAAVGLVLYAWTARLQGGLGGRSPCEDVLLRRALLQALGNLALYVGHLVLQIRNDGEDLVESFLVGDLRRRRARRRRRVRSRGIRIRRGK